MNIQKLCPLLATAALSLIVSSCGDNETADNATSGNGAGKSGIPDSVVAQAAPEGALSVVDARAQAKPGEAITLRGKVGGKMNSIQDVAAILVLADETAIKSCDENEDDLCETPWDYCCEESAKIAASTATIQVRGADGKLVRSTLRGFGGLKELSRLVVAGTVDEASTKDALIVNADKIHVESP